ncbi:fibronectin type III domain-containing protein [Paenibacillus polymyxa]|uniref:stalk domain-containing protein n=1 Tax=Paenibacillus polymyxa TaxID=1406 RepID=UPI0004D92431|nr:fibronectin type III domain-containing protein [Paenibacillus polymyxa]KEO77508.1 peptidase [Paenibacillus polymyxa]MCH6189870.1 fibronectin type III domain-containing protein [Paenibacillus polymyxa]WRL59447.1 fibronectin type III domain-containing protein [Paenibacillus polymyxa]
MNKKRLRQWMAPFATATLILNTGYGILAPDAVASALQTERHNSNLTVLNTAQLHTKLATAQGRQVPVTSGTKVTTLTKGYGQNTYLNQMLKVMSSQMVTANAPTDVDNLTWTPIETTKVNLSWTNPSDINFDHVKVVNVTNAVYEDNIRSNSYMMSGLQPNTTYTFLVKTVNKSGNESQGKPITVKTASTDAPIDKTPPGEVSGLAATNIGYNGFTINYILPKEADLSQAIIYLNGTEIQRTTGTSYTFNVLNAATAYTVTVKTIDKSGNISQGVSIPVTTSTVSTDIVPDVTGASVTSVNNYSVTVSWTRPSGISTVSLYKDGQLVTDSTGTSYTFNNLSASQTYTFTIRSKRSTGTLSSGVRLTATTDSTSSNSSEVSNLEVDSKSDTWIKITYDMPSRADKVKIYVDGDYKGTTSSESYKITDLREGRWYEIKVVTVNSNGRESSGVKISERTDSDGYYSSSSSSSNYEKARDLMRIAENSLNASDWRSARDAISDLPSGTRKSDLLDRLEAIRNRAIGTGSSSSGTSSTTTTTSGTTSSYPNNAVSSYSSSFTLTPGAKSAYVDGRATTMAQAPRIINGATMVPLRFISERIGYEVNYEKSTKKIILNRPTDGKQVVLQVKNSTLAVYELNNSRSYSTNITAPVIVNGYTLVPLRVISELSGYQVNYNTASKQITITK